MSRAVCDPEAFYPLRSLVVGPLTNLGELDKVERLVRTVVLHDEISMELEPSPYDQEADMEFTEEEKRAGGRNVILAFGPMLTDYDFFTEKISGKKLETPEIVLSPTLIDIAEKHSNAAGENVYYKAHIDYLKRIVSIIRKGGSALLAGDFGSDAIDASSKYPEKLFENLDKDWQHFAREANDGKLGFMIPPVISIILSRCARRDAIPTIIKDLRDEWVDARAKMWALLNGLKTVQSIAEMRKIRKELSTVTRLMSPSHDGLDTRPARVLWDLVVGSGSGMAVAQLSGIDPVVGGITGAITSATRSVPTLLNELGPALFGRGAFDLAKRVRRQLLKVEYDALTRILSDAEKRNLGLINP